MGAMVFSSAGGGKRRGSRKCTQLLTKATRLLSCTLPSYQHLATIPPGFRGSLQRLTDENEAGGDDVRQQVASERLFVLSVTFPKDADERVQFVLAQTLPGESHFLVRAFTKYISIVCVRACVCFSVFCISASTLHVIHPFTQRGCHPG